MHEVGLRRMFVDGCRVNNWGIRGGCCRASTTVLTSSQPYMISGGHKVVAGDDGWSEKGWPTTTSRTIACFIYIFLDSGITSSKCRWKSLSLSVYSLVNRWVRTGTRHQCPSLSLFFDHRSLPTPFDPTPLWCRSDPPSISPPHDHEISWWRLRRIQMVLQLVHWFLPSIYSIFL